jgi:integration host factor subunit beta
MNKGQLIDTLTNTLGITKTDSKLCIESVFATMAEALAKGERIEIRGFATFKLKDYSSYMGRNPKSGEVVQVNGKRLPYFKMCNELKSRVNKQSK